MQELLDLHFLRPGWLLIILPALVFSVRSWFKKGAAEQWRGVIAPHLLPHLVSAPGARRWWSPEVLSFPLVVVLALAMAGPAYRLSAAEDGPDDTTLLLVVDLSSSMNATDVGPSRIGRLRLKLRDLIELRRGSRIGLLAVAGTAHVVVPPTDDGDALIPFVDALSPAVMPEDGEAFARVPDLVRSIVERETSGPVLVLVAADSIPPEGAAALTRLSGEGIALVGWPVGTSEGQKSVGIAGVDRTGFEQLERAGADLVELSLGNSDLRRIDRLLDRQRAASVPLDDASRWEDSGYALVFVFALGALLWFRRGWVLGRVGTLALVLLLGGCSATENEKHTDGIGIGSLWLDLWWTPDQQGRRLFERGQFAQAAATFEDPMWKGVAYYAAGNWNDAATQFSRSDTVEGLYNLGNAHAQGKEIGSAIAVYNQVLKKAPTHLAARKNRDLFLDILEGLQQTNDAEELSKEASSPADPSKVELREEQLQGHKDRATEAAQEGAEQANLSAAETLLWMERVTTDPADFLRAKFAIQARSEQAR